MKVSKCFPPFLYKQLAASLPCYLKRELCVYIQLPDIRPVQVSTYLHCGFLLPGTNMAIIFYSKHNNPHSSHLQLAQLLGSERTMLSGKPLWINRQLHFKLTRFLCDLLVPNTSSHGARGSDNNSKAKFASKRTYQPCKNNPTEHSELGKKERMKHLLWWVKRKVDLFPPSTAGSIPEQSH